MKAAFPTNAMDLDEDGSSAELSPLQVALRWKWHILGFALGVAAVAAIYVSQLQPRYDAEVALEIESRQVRVLNAESLLSAQTMDFETLRTEMEAIRSPRMARQVVQQLDLTRAAEFCAPPHRTDWLDVRRLLDRVLADAGLRSGAAMQPAAPPAACEIPLDDAVDRLLGMVSWFLDGRSYIIRISAEATDPVLAARIANAYADAFMARRNDEKVSISRQVTAWMTTYIEALRAQVETANTAVAQYRAQHRLTSLHGETVASQSLSELNSQLTLATGELSQKQSTLSQLTEMLNGRGDPLSSPSAQASPALQSAVAREAELASSAADLRSRLGLSHPKVVAAQAQLAQAHERIRAELSRTIAGLASEVAALKARQAALTSDVNAQQGRVGEQGRDDVQLQALMRDAEAQQKLYETMLQRVKQIDAEQGIQRPDARIVVEARPPGFPSFPRKRMTIAGAFLAALLLGTGAAVVLNLLRRRFRDAEQVEGSLGLRVLGVFPKPPRRTSPQDMMLDMPFSVEAETLHSILASLTGNGDLQRAPHGRVLQLTSALPSEGKSSFAVAIGRSAVRAGLSTILLDCDLRRSAVNAMLHARPDVNPALGLLPGTGTGVRNRLEEAATIDPRTGMHVLALSGCVTPHELLSSRAVRAVIAHLRVHYDFVLLDTPPALVVSDALNMAQIADEVIMVVDFARTPRQAVMEAVRMLRRGGATIAGVVLSKVDLRRYARSYGGYGYNAKVYDSYHAAQAGE